MEFANMLEYQRSGCSVFTESCKIGQWRALDFAGEYVGPQPRRSQCCSPPSFFAYSMALGIWWCGAPSWAPSSSAFWLSVSAVREEGDKGSPALWGDHRLGVPQKKVTALKRGCFHTVSCLQVLITTPALYHFMPRDDTSCRVHTPSSLLVYLHTIHIFK